MAGEVKVTDAGSIQKGSYMIIDGAACKITSVSVSRPGKHGHAKYRIVGIGLIDEKKREVVIPHQDVEVPIIEKKSAQVLSITGDTANVMDSETYETFDMKIPEEMKAEVKEGSNVLYWVILDTKIMKQLKGE